MTDPLRIFIGYDSREPVAFQVLAHSILRRASVPVSITPLVQSQLRASGLYMRDRGPTESTEFSLTRFLVPYLSGFKGHSLFMDCDMLCLADIAEILAPPPYGVDVAVCQHDYSPRPDVKFLGQQQTSYPRKNWSSLAVFDNARCGALAPEYVNTASGLDLHRFNWASPGGIGALPLEWNWLVGEYSPNRQAKILHYTLGGPWFRDCVDCDHAEEWIAEYHAMTQPANGHGR